MRRARKCTCGGTLEPLYRRSMTHPAYPLVPLQYYICPVCGRLESKEGVMVYDPCGISRLMLRKGED